MLRMLSEKEKKEHWDELMEFCRKNRCLMFNVMKMFKNYKDYGDQEGE